MNTPVDITHSRLFLHECTLLLDNKSMFSSLVDSIFDEYTHFLSDSYRSTVFTDSTIKLYRLFYNELKNFLNAKPYGSIQSFVFLDEDWYTLRLEYLIPFIKSAEDDFKAKKIHFDSILNQMDLTNKPSDGEILRQVNFLYSDLQKLEKRESIGKFKLFLETMQNGQSK